MSIYNDLEDKEIIRRVSTKFYDLVYEHPWLGKFFIDIDQEHINDQQIKFMISVLGGPKNYSGRLPSNAHPHMMINDELFTLRKELLEQAMLEERAPQNLIDAWSRIDESFRKVICKEGLADCEKRYHTDTIIDHAKPYIKKAA